MQNRFPSGFIFAISVSCWHLNEFLVGMFWSCILSQVIWKLKLSDTVRCLDALWIWCGMYVSSQFRTYLRVFHNLYCCYINAFVIVQTKGWLCSWNNYYCYFVKFRKGFLLVMLCQHNVLSCRGLWSSVRCFLCTLRRAGSKGSLPFLFLLEIKLRKEP